MDAAAMRDELENLMMLAERALCKYCEAHASGVPEVELEFLKLELKSLIEALQDCQL
ncbi:hypothetical protein [Pseudomonas mosselii]|uniref:hypothetical protein n=1 Tax=Pseudomonas mosselii TaxID=78327 RepID=UPI003F3ADC2B